MITRKHLSLFLFFISLSAGAMAQTTSAIAAEWERAKTYTSEYLAAMSDSGYALKPTPEMRSFAGQMLHLADGNYGLVSAAAGVQSPVKMGENEKSGKNSKADVTKAVLDSYDYAIGVIRKMTPAQLKEKVKLFDQFELTREGALAKAFEHQTHHRGQTTVYLRLAGVKPPAEKLF